MTTRDFDAVVARLRGIVEPLGRLFLGAMVLATVSACVFRGVGDPVFRFGISNQSDVPVIVRFGGRNQYLVQPGEGGVAAEGIGHLQGAIEVLTPDCRLIQSIELTTLTTQWGNVVIGQDGRAEFEPTDSGMTFPLEPTNQCGQ